MKRIPKANAPSVAKLGAAKAGEWIGKANPLETVKALAKSYEEYARIVEEERTKRRKIEAEEMIAIESIRLHRELLMDYLARSFDERRENFDRLFKQLDRAMESGDIKSSSATLVVIVDLAKTSPFKGIESLTELEDSIAKRRQIDF
jgi:hypothetical protein